jgi:hypothetical protein
MKAMVINHIGPLVDGVEPLEAVEHERPRGAA